MPQSKIVTVLDRGTKMVFIITKFESSDSEILMSRGWKLSKELTMITEIGTKVSSTILNEGIVKSSMSVFDYPRYDIEMRTDKLSYTHTTHALAKMVRDMSFDEIPDVIDVRDVNTTEQRSETANTL